MSSASVESDQDEASQMTIDLHPMPHPVPVPTERTGKESCSLTAIQVPFPRSWLRRKRNRNETVNLPLFPTPSKSRTQHDKLATSRRFLDGLAMLFCPRVHLLYAPTNVCVAGHTRDCGKGLVAEEFHQLSDCHADQIGPPCGRSVIFTVLGQHVRNQNSGRMTIAELRATLAR
jgi:hypothetical protein